MASNGVTDNESSNSLPYRIRLGMVREQIRECNDCELRGNCRKPVPVYSPVHPTDIAIIGEAPGQTEDRIGKPFIGPAGKKARQWLYLAGINPDNVAWLNVVSCYPGSEIKTPGLSHIRACGRNLTNQLSVLQPSFTLVLGSVGLSAFQPELKISKSRGIWWKERLGIGGSRIESWFMATYHPAAILRDVNLEGAAMEDVLKFKRIYFTGREFPRSDVCGVCGWKADVWDSKDMGWCNRHKPKGKVKGGLKEMEGQDRLW